MKTILTYEGRVHCTYSGSVLQTFYPSGWTKIEPNESNVKAMSQRTERPNKAVIRFFVINEGLFVSFLCVLIMTNSSWISCK